MSRSCERCVRRCGSASGPTPETPSRGRSRVCPWALWKLSYLVRTSRLQTPALPSLSCSPIRFTNCTWAGSNARSPTPSKVASPALQGTMLCPMQDPAPLGVLRKLTRENVTRCARCVYGRGRRFRLGRARGSTSTFEQRNSLTTPRPNTPQEQQHRNSIRSTAECRLFLRRFT
eukprot:6449948-Prymnesium_polylepis.1